MRHSFRSIWRKGVVCYAPTLVLLLAACAPVTALPTETVTVEPQETKTSVPTESTNTPIPPSPTYFPTNYPGTDILGQWQAVDRADGSNLMLLFEMDENGNMTFVMFDDEATECDGTPLRTLYSSGIVEVHGWSSFLLVGSGECNVTDEVISIKIPFNHAPQFEGRPHLFDGNMQSWTRPDIISKIPTLTQENPQERLTKLLKTNGGCQFPCWWGLTPGEATWAQAENLFSTLTYAEIQDFELDATRGYLVTFTAEPTTTRDGLFKLRVDVDNKGIITTIRTMRNWDVQSQDYSLPGILRLLGKPSEIWLQVHPNAAIGPFYLLVLFYPDKGVSAKFTSEADFSISSTAICLDRIKQPSPALNLWSPLTIRTFDDIHEVSTDDKPYEALGEVTDIDVQVFYDRYKESNSLSECFYSPVDIWP
ncbi:MAG: hypothetical protein DWQ07_20550 [Chloroflexi bacterium]|nr:MAG: hypothetical protein DWQ07_20550 [Chloroflexota bacterium]MBL1194474.1 hypothetical protein [Chloroflexota bacterium]NOH11762.1 hypothetical protein [Chloroflexota bacterium]